MLHPARCLGVAIIAGVLVCPAQIAPNTPASPIVTGDPFQDQGNHFRWPRYTEPRQFAYTATIGF